jgi:hypothetical protein
VEGPFLILLDLPLGNLQIGNIVLNGLENEPASAQFLGDEVGQRFSNNTVANVLYSQLLMVDTSPVLIGHYDRGRLVY